MKKKLLLITVLLFTSTVFAQYTELVEMAKEKNKIEKVKCIQGDCENGWGVLQYSDGTVTASTFLNKKLDGIAYVETMSNGQVDIYRGQYKEGVRNGSGIYWGENKTYVGSWKNGLPNGLGFYILTIDGIKKFEAGFYKNGEITDRLDTDFHKEKMEDNCLGDCNNGFAMYFFESGAIYIGFYKDGIRSGYGTYIDQNKNHYMGKYTSKSRRTGFGYLIYANGDTFMGMFKNNNIDGLGIKIINETGEKQVGVFKNTNRISNYKRFPESYYYDDEFDDIFRH